MDAHDLAEWWPEVEPRLHAALAARGVPAGDIADVVQETAARALAARPDVADADALARWAFTVAWRIVIDGSRRRAARPAKATLPAPEPAAPGDVAGIVEHRLRWQKALRAMAALSAADRSALTSALTAEARPDARPADRRAAVRDAVRLHRARTRLVAMMAKLGAVAAAAWRAMRRLLEHVADSPATRLAMGAAVVVAAVIGLARPTGTPRAGAEPAAPRPPKAAAPSLSAPRPVPATPPAVAAAARPAASARAPAAARAAPAAAKPRPIVESKDAGVMLPVGDPGDPLQPHGYVVPVPPITVCRQGSAVNRITVCRA